MICIVHCSIRKVKFCVLFIALSEKLNFVYCSFEMATYSLVLGRRLTPGEELLRQQCHTNAGTKPWERTGELIHDCVDGQQRVWNPASLERSCHTTSFLDQDDEGACQHVLSQECQYCVADQLCRKRYEHHQCALCNPKLSFVMKPRAGVRIGNNCVHTWAWSHLDVEVDCENRQRTRYNFLKNADYPEVVSQPQIVKKKECVVGRQKRPRRVAFKGKYF